MRTVKFYKAQFMFKQIDYGFEFICFNHEQHKYGKLLTTWN